MRAFVTGASGFVGTHLVRHLVASGDEVVALPHDVDICDAATVGAALADARPDVVLHLAGWADVGASWTAAAEVFRVNVVGTVTLLAACAGLDPMPRVLVVGSADAYGPPGPDTALPIAETAPLLPVSPYGASKAAGEVAALQAFRGRGLPVVLTRSFNHTGAGQGPSFVVPALARRIVAAQADGSGVVAVGNLDARRDLLDVADVVRAYRTLAIDGDAGSAYNVCSGRAVAIREVAERLAALAGGDVRLEIDPALLRPVDVPLVVGDASRLTSLGWTPAIDLDDTLAAVLAHERAVAPT